MKMGLKSSQFPSFSRCRNIAKGDAFIIASGPSAKGFPIEAFAGTPMIAMNGSISLFQGTGIRPFFYASSDTSFARQQPKLFEQALATSMHVALWPEQIEAHRALIGGQAFALQKATQRGPLSPLWPCKDYTWHPTFRRRSRSIGFSRDMALGFFDARTVAFLALQLAYHAGFRRVFMVGVDLNQTANRFYEGDDSDKAPCNFDDHYEHRILPCFKLLNELRREHGFEVFNLSAYSRLPEDVVPRISMRMAEAMIAATKPCRPAQPKHTHRVYLCQRSGQQLPKPCRCC